MAEREGRTRAGYIAAREIQFRVISGCGQVLGYVRTMYACARSFGPIARSNATERDFLNCFRETLQITRSAKSVRLENMALYGMSLATAMSRGASFSIKIIFITVCCLLLLYLLRFLSELGTLCSGVYCVLY